MIVQPSIESHPVTDYDITFTNGLFYPITIDEQAGDSVDWDTSPLTVIFKHASKPHATDPDASTPAEETTVFIQHILSIARRTRIVIPATPDQKEEWKSAYRKLSSTIQ